jgi:hypothetical protein
MNRQSEIQAVKALGNQIGYGNVMHIASALWANKLKTEYDIPIERTGAFVSTLIYDLKEGYQEAAINGLLELQGDIELSNK